MAKVAKSTKSTKADKAAEIAAQLTKSLAPKTSPATSKSGVGGEKKTASRSTGTYTLTFNLVTIPVKLYKATDQDRVEFNKLHDVCDMRIRQQLYCPHCNSLADGHTHKGFEYEKDKYVFVTDEELEACEPASDKLMDVVDFVPATQIDPIRIESTSYIGPDKGGERAFALLRAGLVNTGRVGILKFVTRGRENVAYIRPYGHNGLAVHYMFYENEVRDFNGWASVPTADMLNPKEVELVNQLINAMGGDFDSSQYSDSYNENVRALLQSKIGKKPAPKVVKKQVQSGSNDLMSALMSSVETAKARKVAVKK